MQIQLDHKNFKEKQVKRNNQIMFVLENLEHMENIGSAFRLADAFNICEIIIISNSTMEMKKIHKTARNCEKTVKYQIVSTCDKALEIINKAKYKPVNIEITTTSLPLKDINFKELKKIAIIVGSEKNGISEEMLSKVEKSAHIEMYGNNSSLNVATALAIATYHISEKLNN